VRDRARVERTALEIAGQNKKSP